MKVINLSLVISAWALALVFNASAAKHPTGNAIFLHPDGVGMANWVAVRMLEHGPDGMTHWDKLETTGLYRGHQRDSLNTSSHAGATAHAYGIRVPTDSYGMFGKEPLKARSGFEGSILQEAKSKGLVTGIINSGHIAEPGTGVYAASSPSRGDTDSIAEQIILSDMDIIMSGGEIMLLPEGIIGKHGKEGERKDGQNLIEVAKSKGYTVIYTRDELLNLDSSTDKVLGVFAAEHTFNDEPEEVLKEQGLPNFNEGAPTIAEMTAKALEIVEYKGKQYCLIIEEEGTDNFANKNNANGALQALSYADQAIGVILEYLEKHKDTLLIMASDSEAGGPEVISPARDSEYYFPEGQPLPERVFNGAPLDGIEGTNTPPFVSKPDRFGETHTFGISWATFGDISGGVIARAHGFNAESLPKHVENIDIYRVMYHTLFGVWPE